MAFKVKPVRLDTAAFWANFALRVQHDNRGSKGDDRLSLAFRAFGYAENRGIVLQ